MPPNVLLIVNRTVQNSMLPSVWRQHNTLRSTLSTRAYKNETTIIGYSEAIAGFNINI